MLHFVQQLVANFVCLVVGAKQVVYSWFLELFDLEQLPHMAKHDARRAVNEPKHLSCVPENQNKELKAARKLHRADGNCMNCFHSLGFVTLAAPFTSYIVF